MIKLRNLFPHDFVDVKSLCRFENHSNKEKKSEWGILGAITPSVTQQVSKVQNERCFGSVLLSFLKCLLMVTTRDKTVG